MASKYPLIRQYILDNIDSKKYLPGNPIETEGELTNLFAVSRMTVRRAIDDLIEEGILTKRHSTTPIVCTEKVTRNPSSISISNDEYFQKKYQNLKAEIINFEIKENSYHAKKYLDGYSANVYKIVRVQKGDKEIISLEYIYLPCANFTKLEKEDCLGSLEKTIYERLINKSNNLTRDVIVEAAIANKDISKLLHLAEKSPILKVINVVRDNDEKLYCGINYYAADQYNFAVSTPLERK